MGQSRVYVCYMYLLKRCLGVQEYVLNFLFGGIVCWIIQVASMCTQICLILVNANSCIAICNISYAYMVVIFTAYVPSGFVEFFNVQVLTK